MRGLISLALTALLLGPIASSADPIRLYYEGTVTRTQGNGLGFSISDEISGWFDFDPHTSLQDPYGDGRWISSRTPVTSSESAFVDAHRYSSDQTDEYAYAFYGFDQFAVRDGSSVSYGCAFCSSRTYYGRFHNILFRGYSEFFGRSLLVPGFSLAGSDFDLAIGSLRDYSYSSSRWYSYYRYNNEAAFSIDHLYIPGVAVAEPGTLVLLGSGLAGLVFLRRRRSLM